MLKALSSFFFLLLLLSPRVSFAAEQETLSTGTLTVQEYTEFLQATAATDSYSLYNEKMGDDLLFPCIIREGDPGSYSYQAIPEHADDPVPYVSRLSAKRYCNWLQNGKPEGEQDKTTTERGAYILDGTMEEDPKREEGATYFLPTSTNSEIDPSLASNLTTYVIMTHLGDSFRFSNTSSSKDETTAWTVGGFITGVAGLAAVLHYRGGMMHGEEPSDHDDVDPAHRTAERRREEETQKISAEQRGDNISSELDQEDSASTTRSATPLEPWAKSTDATINNDYLKWLANQYDSKKSLIEQLNALSQTQQEKIGLQKFWTSDKNQIALEKCLEAIKHFHLIRARLSSPSKNLNWQRDSNAALATWLQQSQPLLYRQYLNFTASRTPEEFQTTCFSRWFKDPEDSRKKAYETFITEVITEHQIGRQYWPHEKLLAEWKTQAAAPWAQPLENEVELRACIAQIPAWKRPTKIPVQRQPGRPSVFFTGTLSDERSMLCPSCKIDKNDPRLSQWGPKLKILLASLSDKWLKQNPDNLFYQTIDQKIRNPQQKITWQTELAWGQWHEEFKKSPALVQEAITKKTDLLNDWENWREYSYGPHPRSLEVLKKEAADIWKAQVEATLDELNELSQIANKIQEGEHKIISALLLQQTFEILFETTFSHLHLINTNINDAQLDTTLFTWESLMKAQLAEWSERLNDGSLTPDFVPSDFKTQIETAIAAAKILAKLVDKHQDQALRLRQIAEEEKNQQQRTTEASELDRSSFGSTESGKTDKEIITTPVHSSGGRVRQPTPFSGKSFTQFPFPPVTGDGHNGSTSNEHVSDSSTSLF